MNDAAERKVKLFSDFNDFGTKNEKKKQEIVRNTEYVRQKVKKVNKKNLKHFTLPKTKI